MQANKINFIVKSLSLNNYFTNAIIAPSGDFFNSKRAYESLGFDNVSYLQDKKEQQNNEFLNDKLENNVLYDGDLSDLNIRFLEKHSKNNNKPIFNYVLGMYGHLPFERKTKLRPNVINTNHSDDRHNRITNQFYYRIETLANYLEKLIEIDPNSIIFVTSDHLPSVLSEDAHYQLNNKMNIALLIDSGKTVDVSGKKLFQIPGYYGIC
jgi:phosphoglycerol transferase MdoB-like AlkP superfamily enzyme